MRSGLVLLDRDGVVNELVPDPESGLPESPLHVEDVVLAATAIDGLRLLRHHGWRLGIVSNQPAAAKGKVPLDELLAVNQRVIDLVSEAGVAFDSVRLCLHHPDGIGAALRGACRCRKPAPGMLVDTAHDLGADLARSWMIGDTDADVLAGQRAGCQTVLVTNRSSAHKRTGDVRATAEAPTVGAAAELVIAADQEG